MWIWQQYLLNINSNVVSTLPIIWGFTVFLANRLVRTYSLVRRYNTLEAFFFSHNIIFQEILVLDSCLYKTHLTKVKGTVIHYVPIVSMQVNYQWLYLSNRGTYNLSCLYKMLYTVSFNSLLQWLHVWTTAITALFLNVLKNLLCSTEVFWKGPECN